MECDAASLLLAAKCLGEIPTGVRPGVRDYLLCQWANKQTGCRHATVDNWVTRVAANGGTTTGLEVGGTIYNALCNFMTGLDAANLTGQMVAVNCFVPGQASPATAAGDVIRAITPLIRTLGNDPWTNSGPFVPADLTVDGLLSNGTKYLRTGVLPNPAFPDDVHGAFSLYNMTALNSATIEMGCGTGAVLIELAISHSGVGNSTLWDCYNAAAARASGANAAWTGFLTCNRTSAVSSTIYKGSSAIPALQLVGSTVGSGGTRPNAEDVYIYARNLAGVANNLCSRRLSFAAIHQGLVLADARVFFTLVQAMRVALGGGYV